MSWAHASNDPLVLHWSNSGQQYSTLHWHVLGRFTTSPDNTACLVSHQCPTGPQVQRRPRVLANAECCQCVHCMKPTIPSFQDLRNLTTEGLQQKLVCSLDRPCSPFTKQCHRTLQQGVTCHSLTGVQLTLVLDASPQVYQGKVLKAAVLAKSHPDVGKLDVAVPSALLVQPCKCLQSSPTTERSSWVSQATSSCHTHGDHDQ